MPAMPPPTLGSATAVLAVCDEVSEQAAAYAARLAPAPAPEPAGLRPSSLSEVAAEMAHRRDDAPAEAQLLAWLCPDAFGRVLLAEAAQATPTPPESEAPASEAARAVAALLASLEPVEARVRGYRDRLGVEPDPEAEPEADPRGLIDALVEAGHGSRAEVAALPFEEALQINARAALEAQRTRQRMEKARVH